MANNWTREQLIVTFNLYCKIPFAKAVQTNPDVIRVAEIIGRSPGAVAFKLGNFGSFDLELKKRGIGGLPNTSKLDRQIWDEFHENWDQLAFESERLISEFSNTPMEELKSVQIDDLPVGADRESIVRVRVNQGFFRRSVLSIYGDKCCITGIDLEPLLIASHIVPWRLAEKDRTNPQNGLCLNAFHDRAFDRGLITITPDYKILISREFRTASSRGECRSYFEELEGRNIDLPDKFFPDRSFLKFHNDAIFRK
ncbi:MAG TPA: HNH endonuclease [Pyrinomonadaceae bacterium]|nr:HNH endonuclease [Pyrinomonadaceae bacterium]HMP65324.1 HNH endonuclease [Pyrinomonadaceae bacterium]